MMKQKKKIFVQDNFNFKYTTEPFVSFLYNASIKTSLATVCPCSLQASKTYLYYRDS